MVNLEKNDFQDPYIDQSSGCLNNLLHINDPKARSKAESSFALIRSYELELEQIFIEKTFDFQHLKAIHKHLFQDVYEWAGKVREVNVSKGETYFTPYSRIEKNRTITRCRKQHS